MPQARRIVSGKGLEDVFRVIIYLRFAGRLHYSDMKLIYNWSKLSPSCAATTFIVSEHPRAMAHVTIPGVATFYYI